MIFTNSKLNNTSKIICLGKYNPYRIRGERNPNFDRYSELILDVKESNKSSIDIFFDRINSHLSYGIAICVVPSHDPEKTSSGIKYLAQRLCENNRIDATSCLVRHTKIDKLAHGGDRSKDVHLKSIRCENNGLVYNEEVLLLDDVTTTHNSLFACQSILLSAGAASVQCLALARTV